jgi:endoglucanase
MLKRLCNAIGVSGYENKVISFLYQELQNTVSKAVYIDKVGNLICKQSGVIGDKKVMICAHIDEVGFQIIKSIDDKKYKIKPMGNIKTWNAFQQRVKSENSSGIIHANDENHLLSNDYENLFLEIVSDKDAEIGDVFTFDSNLMDHEHFYVGKALDNRIACCLLFNAIISDLSTKEDVYFVFTTQEEIGMRGIRYAKSTIKPDICIGVDTSPESRMNSLVVDQGVGIKVSDSVYVSSPKLVEQLKDLAEKNDIRYQMEVSDCGTSELIISNEQDNGYEEIGLSIPCKYPHSANTIVSKHDVAECAKMISLVLSSM